MKVPVRIEPASGSPVPVEYRWDADTDILSARLCVPADANGGSGSVDVEGSDGSWLILDVAGGRIRGVEVAVWPPVRKRSRLDLPADVQDASVTVTTGNGDGVAAVEVNTALAAESDQTERTIHFRLGAAKRARTVRIAREILLDVDADDRLAGVWLLDVPPFPEAP